MKINAKKLLIGTKVSEIRLHTQPDDCRSASDKRILAKEMAALYVLLGGYNPMRQNLKTARGEHIESADWYTDKRREFSSLLYEIAQTIDDSIMQDQYFWK